MIFLCNKNNKVLLIYCSFSFFFFLKDQKLKKLALTLKLLTVLSFNSNVFWYFCLLVKIPLHCINLQRQGKPETLEP